MSELSRGIQVSTSQVARPVEGLVNLRAVARKNRQRGNAQIGDSLRELGQTIKDYGSWRDAKKAEDEVRSVDDAYALGMQTGEPEKALVTLGAVRPTTAAAATLRAKRMDEAMESARKRTKSKLDEAQDFAQRQRWNDETKNTNELLKIRQAELELAQGKEARLGAEPPRGSRETGYNTPIPASRKAEFAAWKQKYAPQDSGADYDLQGAFLAGLTPDPQTGHWPDTFKKPNHPTFSNESQYSTEPGAEPGYWEGEGPNAKFVPPASRRPKAPDYRDEPLPPKVQALLEEKASLKPGSLDGFTRGDWDEIKSNPSDEMLKQLRIIAAQRDAAEHEPPKLKAARKALETVQNRLDVYRNTMTTASIMADKKAMDAREKELEGEVATAQSAVTAEEGKAAQPAQGATADPFLDAMTPEARADFLNLSPAAQDIVRKKAR